MSLVSVALDARPSVSQTAARWIGRLGVKRDLYSPHLFTENY